jgi:hypothetical protein
MRSKPIKVISEVLVCAQNRSKLYLRCWSARYKRHNMRRVSTPRIPSHVCETIRMELPVILRQLSPNPDADSDRARVTLITLLNPNNHTVHLGHIGQCHSSFRTCKHSKHSIRTCEAVQQFIQTTPELLPTGCGSAGASAAIGAHESSLCNKVEAQVRFLIHKWWNMAQADTRATNWLLRLLNRGPIDLERRFRWHSGRRTHIYSVRLEYDTKGAPADAKSRWIEIVDTCTSGFKPKH